MVIAHALGHIYRMADGTYGDLSMKILEDPYDHWEQGKGSTADEQARDKKYDALCEKLQLRSEADTRHLVTSRWGFDDKEVGGLELVEGYCPFSPRRKSLEKYGW